MDQGLFAKYARVLTKQSAQKEALITFLQQETGVVFLPEEIVVEKHTITFHVSSVKKMILKKKEVQDFFKENALVYKP